MSHGHDHKEDAASGNCGSDCDHDHGNAGHGHGREEKGHGHNNEEVESGSEGGGHLIGGLILRGNRCVLIRSLDGEWEGMRIPSAAADETGPDAALQVASDLCGIEASELHVLRAVRPVTIAVPGMPIDLYAIYAVNPPPPGPLEAADEEDPEDIYDWYTFPRAMQALASDSYARAALASMACALAAGAAGGLVPNHWGGVFGQEWTGPAFRLIPGGLELEKGSCTIEQLVEADEKKKSQSQVKAEDGIHKRRREDGVADQGQASGQDEDSPPSDEEGRQKDKKHKKEKKKKETDAELQARLRKEVADEMKREQEKPGPGRPRWSLAGALASSFPAFDDRGKKI